MEKQSGTKPLDTYWWLTKLMLKIIALWPVLDNDSLITKILHNIHLFTITIGTISQIIGMTAMCYMNFTDFLSAAKSIGPMMGLYVAFGKIFLYRHQPYRLINLVRSIENSINNENCDEYKYLEKFIAVGILAFGSLHCCCIILSVGYLSFPLFLSERMLPWEVYYPWDWKNSTILYIISYSHEVIITLLLTSANATELTYVWSICHCCARLRVVQQKLIDVSSSEEEAIDKFIASFVKIHTDVLSDVELINGAYTNIVLLLFLAAVVAICCAGLQITSALAESTYIILFLLLAIYFAEQLLFYYLPGDILADEASAMGFAAYSCGWEFFEPKHRKSISLVIMKSNSQLKLKAGNLSSLRLESYASFLATTMSYFTSIQAVTTT